MTNEMTPELLALLSPEQQEAWDRCQKATPGGWYAVFSADGRMEMEVIVPGGTKLIATVTSGSSDWHFISHARLDLPAALLELAQTKAKLAELRAAVDACPHGYCHKQTEPHCAHCGKVRGTHYWGSKWGEDGTCRDDRGRPEKTKWTPVDPKPCDCWKSRIK